MKRNIHRKQIIILLLLCAAMLAKPAMAAEVVNLSGEKNENLSYRTTLADGRILLTGNREAPDWNTDAGRLLCLNRDRTVRWEFTEESTRNLSFSQAVQLPDGTIGTVLRKWDEGEGLEWSLRFFTPDGKPMQKEVVIKVNGTIPLILATESRVLILETQDARRVAYRLIDWKGKEIAKLDDSISLVSNFMPDEGDSFVMFADVKHDNHLYSAVVKVDGEGKVIWETVLPLIWPDRNNDSAVNRPGFFLRKAEDGGYLGIQEETLPSGRGSRKALVKLDSEGNILWTNTEVFEGITDSCMDFTVSGGKIAACFHPSGLDPYVMSAPRTIIVADENGMNPVKMELNVTPEDIGRMEQYIQDNAGTKAMTPLFYEDRLLFMDDGLWMTAVFSVFEEQEDYRAWDSTCTALVKVPEP